MKSMLEEFVGEYLQTAGGVWDEVEPQVYDVLLPPDVGSSRWDATDQSVLRVTFDSEALSEHPGAQLASYGTPLVERFLADAVERGRFAEFYLLGLNLAPHDLTGRVRKLLTFKGKLEWQPQRVRLLFFPQAFFWFRATLVSDQREQEIVSVALDLHYGRVVRHREKLLDPERLAEQPGFALPPARRLSLPQAFPLARDEALRSINPMANHRERELGQRLHRQVERMTRYYADLRQELDQGRRVAEDPEAIAKRAARRESIQREERLRIEELRKKSSLQVSVQLQALALIQQPKMLIQGQVTGDLRLRRPLEIVWDPLVENLEAFPCPSCACPTFALDVAPPARMVCPECLAKR